MTLANLVNQVIALIDATIPVLVGIAILFFLFSCVRYIYKAGDAGGKAPERAAIGWGLVALFVLASVWGILGIFKNVLFPSF